MIISDHRSQITDHKLYTISEVAEKLNLSTKTLRRWENEGKFSASRTIGGQRRYTLEDLQILDAIKHGTIPSKSDLLTLEQAANLFGVSPQTIVRWENEGKIHPFITSGNTYYPKSKLVEKIESLKKSTPPTTKPNLEEKEQSLTGIPEMQSQEGPEVQRGGTVPDAENGERRTCLRRQAENEESTNANAASAQSINRKRKTENIDPQVARRWSLVTILTNFLLTLLLLLGYHTLTSHQSLSQPTPSPEPEVKGLSTAQTPLQKTLQSILSLTGDINTPGNITTKTNLTVGKFLSLLPSTPPTNPTPGTLYYDASSQTLKLFTQNKWYQFPDKTLLQPQQTQLKTATLTFPKGKTKFTVDLPELTPTSPITITFLDNYFPAKKYWLTRQSGKFTLHLDFPPQKDVPFTYLLIIPQKPSPTTQNQTPNPSSSPSPSPNI